ncbi:MAG: helix-turn-helix transcriptional regulator [Bacteroidota bacterium]|nr:helix-turn-helix transcriptional regulator [Bacteroidota bacterium]
MTKQSNILLIEPSSIIVGGIENLLYELGAVNFQACRNIPKHDPNCIAEEINWDIVIINPVVINNCPNLKKNLNKQFKNATFIALLTTLYDRSFCDMFQECIYLNDDKKTILNILRKYTQQNKSKLQYSNILSDRETEVLKLLIRGDSIKEIADKLHISNHTSLSHRRNISDKLSIKSVAAMAIYAVAAKIIDPNESLEELK